VKSAKMPGEIPAFLIFASGLYFVFNPLLILEVEE